MTIQKYAGSLGFDKCVHCRFQDISVFCFFFLRYNQESAITKKKKIVIEIICSPGRHKLPGLFPWVGIGWEGGDQFSSSRTPGEDPAHLLLVKSVLKSLFGE